MLEYFAYKKVKKHQAKKKEQETAERLAKDGAAASPSSIPASPGGVPRVVEPGPSDAHTVEPLLKEEDEHFLRLLTSGSHPASGQRHGDGGYDDDGGPRPPLPPRIKTPEIGWDSDADSFLVKGKGKGKAGGEMALVEKPKDGEAGGGGKFTDRIGRRISVLVRRQPSRKHHQQQPDVHPTGAKEQLGVPDADAERERDDLTRVLNDLNLSAQNNRAFSLSPQSAELVGRFTLVLKDLVNGVPTAANDLKLLVEDPDGHLAKNFDRLPSSMRKLVETLPDKVTATMAPELMRAAAESQGLKHDDDSKGGLKDTAMRLLMPSNLQELVTKPSAIVGMLKAIMNALKLRWPAFIGTNVMWSLAIFLLLFVLWYCHKRGREVRLEAERATEAGDRIEELPDDPLLPAPPADASGSASASGAVAAKRTSK
ncbi:hypothetical protein MAPG_05150 [Magnaporthiopsis poae ATCC 64411]|uniref:Uncharacterized protein n=1 Tax=Magnaporthiopsis poae (strain ATCC 64411 / 73-15) TaxID=644358 RepID=A0A0C4DYM4_MAGP6|nr:hypothetical protein MAPG_05150 [Magnaporthiopsis poae ATCC 64411]